MKLFNKDGSATASNPNQATVYAVAQDILISEPHLRQSPDPVIVVDCDRDQIYGMDKAYFVIKHSDTPLLDTPGVVHVLFIEDGVYTHRLTYPKDGK